MTGQTLNICYFGTKRGFDVDKLDKVLRAIVDVSEEASVYAYDEITTAYPHLGPLHFDFLPMPLILRYNTGIVVWESIEKPLLLQSQGVLLDLGIYQTHSKMTDGDLSNNLLLVAATKKFQKPTIYMVHGVEEQIEMDLLKAKMRLEESDVLMVYDKSAPISLKEILQKLVNVILE